MPANLPGAQIPLSEAALCVDCMNVFSIRDGACGKCGSNLGWTALSSNRAAKVIQEQRELLELCEATLRVISLRRLGPTSRMAQRLVDELRQKREKVQGVGALPEVKAAVS